MLTFTGPLQQAECKQVGQPLPCCAGFDVNKVGDARVGLVGE